MSDTLTRFREEAERLHAPERSRRRAELLERMRRDAVALIGLSSEIAARSETEKRLEQLVEQLRATTEEWRAGIEKSIDLVLGLADLAARIWETMWKMALDEPAKDRAEHTKELRSTMEDAEKRLRNVLDQAEQDAHRFERPLARLDELQSRADEFPLWARECLARWEMLDEPAPPLDPERIARARAAYARGEHEDLDDVLSRVQEGGPWLKE